MRGFEAAALWAGRWMVVCAFLAPAMAQAVCSVDGDGDGFGEGACAADCDDSDPDVYPGAPEICDGQDSNCDGVVHLDPGFEPLWSTDLSFGAVRLNRYRVDRLLRLRRVDVWAGGGALEAIVVAQEGEWGLDVLYLGPPAGLDGGWRTSSLLPYDFSPGAVIHVGAVFGSGGAVGHENASDVPIPTVFGAWLDSRTGTSGDLTNTLVSASPYAVRLGFDDEVDADGDGSAECADCDDDDPDRYPGAEELCDGIDGDCSGSVPAWDRDDDGDGVLVCEGDCDDGDPRIAPTIDEVCDGLDNNCDGFIPPQEGVDNDGDSWFVCADCDDDRATVYPDADEICDGHDNDCDGVVPSREQADSDGDGSVLCADCDDGHPQVLPGAQERCDGLDNDCDGEVPGNELDEDGDGWLACTECNDADPDDRPDQREECDGVDADCSGGAAWRMEGELAGWTARPPGLVGYEVAPHNGLWLEDLRTWIRPGRTGLVGHIVYEYDNGSWDERWRSEHVVAPEAVELISPLESPFELREGNRYLLALYSTVELDVSGSTLPLELVPGLLDASPVYLDDFDLSEGSPSPREGNRFAVWARFRGEEDLDFDGRLDCEGPPEPEGCGARSPQCTASGSLAFLLPLLGWRRMRRIG